MATAQTSPLQSAASGIERQASDVPEIIVTALKRSENLHDLPATIQVVNAMQLAQASVTSLVCAL
jgi:hypothetical protein